MPFPFPKVGYVNSLEGKWFNRKTFEIHPSTHQTQTVPTSPTRLLLLHDSCHPGIRKCLAGFVDIVSKNSWRIPQKYVKHIIRSKNQGIVAFCAAKNIHKSWLFSHQQKKVSQQKQWDWKEPEIIAGSRVVGNPHTHMQVILRLANGFSSSFNQSEIPLLS